MGGRCSVFPVNDDGDDDEDENDVKSLRSNHFVTVRRALSNCVARAVFMLLRVFFLFFNPVLAV